MKAYWMIDQTAIAVFDTIDEAVEKLEKLQRKSVVDIQFGNKLITVETSTIGIETEREDQ